MILFLYENDLGNRAHNDGREGTRTPDLTDVNRAL